MASDARSSDPVSNWGTIEVERLGGLAGYGQPGARLRSRCRIQARDLSPADQATLQHIFLHPTPTPAPGRDAFRYSFTRQLGEGVQTVIVAETVVPQAIRNCVRDEFVSP
ncbi:hypothetical protein D3C78_1733600 [compost metagenome]